MKDIFECWTFLESEKELSIKIDRPNIQEYYLKKLNDWLVMGDEKVPSVYDLFNDIFQQLEQAFQAKRFSKYFLYHDFRKISSEYLGLGWRMGISWLLDPPNSPYQSFSFSFSTPPNTIARTVCSGSFFQPVEKSWGTPVLEHKIKFNKQSERHKFTFSNFYLGKPEGEILRELLEQQRNCKCNISTLIPRGFIYSSMLQYICLICGKAYVCNCFEPFEKFWKNETGSVLVNEACHEREKVNPGVATNWRYREDICHLCRGIKPDQEFTSSNYCSKFAAHFAPWIIRETQKRQNKKHIKTNSLEFRNVENELREKLGVPRIGEGWISETQLYRSLLAFFGNQYEIIHHARPQHLLGQEYDIYFPAHRIAIEYDGAQHFEPVEIFGGEKGLELTQKRDRAKEKKARDNGVCLIRVQENYNFDLIVKKIERILSQQEQHN